MLAIKDGKEEGSIVCVKDPDDDVYSWQKTCRSSTFACNGAGLALGTSTGEPRWIDGASYTIGSTDYLYSWVTFEDGWTVIEFEDENADQCCFDPLPEQVGVMSSADSAVLMADTSHSHICYGIFKDSSGFQICENLEFCCLNFDHCIARMSHDMTVRSMKVDYEEQAGTKHEESQAQADEYGPEGEQYPLFGDAVYRWHDGDSTTKPYLWVETKVGWNIEIDPSGWNDPLVKTTYIFRGKVEIDLDGDGYPDMCSEFFDTDYVDPEPGYGNGPLESKEVTYNEMGYGNPPMPVAWWEPPAGDEGTWDSGDGAADQEDASLAEVGPAEVFHIGTMMRINVERAPNSLQQKGAGNTERTDYIVLLRFRAQEQDPN